MCVFLSIPVDNLTKIPKTKPRIMKIKLVHNAVYMLLTFSDYVLTSYYVNMRLLLN